MPKAKARKRRKAKSQVVSGASHTALADAPASKASTEASPRDVRTARRSKASGIQSLVMAGMVALGCWGMAISFIFFTADPNRYMYGGIAVLMALMWSYLFGVRLWKARLQK